MIISKIIAPYFNNFRCKTNLYHVEFTILIIIKLYHEKNNQLLNNIIEKKLIGNMDSFQKNWFSFSLFC